MAELIGSQQKSSSSSLINNSAVLDKEILCLIMPVQFHVACLHFILWPGAKQENWKSLLKCFKPHNFPKHRPTCRNRVREDFEQEKVLSATWIPTSALLTWTLWQLSTSYSQFLPCSDLGHLPSFLCSFRQVFSTTLNHTLDFGCSNLCSMAT